VTDEDSGATVVQVPDASARFPGSWTLDAKTGSFKVENDDETSAIVQGVSGQLLKGENVESRFTADSGVANMASGKLVLEGHVKVTSETDKIYMTAQRVTYNKDSALVVAEGMVTVHLPAGQVSGPYDRLVATPGLEKVGTADRFGL
jgi:lipopolysaccharide assembly outer membrane protein LptD (OstA)